MNQITGQPLSANMLRNFERGILLNGCYFERSVTCPFSETTFPTLCCLETKAYIASYCIDSFLQTSFFRNVSFSVGAMSLFVSISEIIVCSCSNNIIGNGFS